VTTARRTGRLIDNKALLRARLTAAPASPGVYIMRDVQARVAYVGKAANLRNRLRSYFTGVDSHQPRTHELVERIFDFEVIACANEREALILENTLIKQHRPRFNVRLKDDKNYLYLKIPKPGASDVLNPGTAREGVRKARGSNDASLFPRPYYTRKIVRDGARYFGPYTSAKSLRSTVKSLRTIFPFRTCSDEVFRRGHVCLDYHIKRCSGPCEKRVDEATYAELLEQVGLFMDGHSRVLEEQIGRQMEQASSELEFEKAARLRDRLGAVSRVREKQRMLRGKRSDEDYIALAAVGDRGMAAVISVRDGRVAGMETHAVEGVSHSDRAEALASFVAQFYSGAPFVPRAVLVEEPLDDASLAEFLSSQRGGPVELRSPQRGDSRQLMTRAAQTAASALTQQRVIEDYDSERTTAILEDLATVLGLAAPPRRIECYDISNTMGTNSVGSMVVFEDGRPEPSRYRFFGIKTVSGPDDFASMKETLRRRFARYIASGGTADVPVVDPAGANGEKPKARNNDDSFAALPDLIIIDGGKGQLSSARAAVIEAGLGEVPMFGLAKRNEELYGPGSDSPIVLPKDSPTLFLVQRIRDEAHRFAITRHRSKRGKTALTSKLDIVPGLGPARRRVLLRRFGSLDAIRNATVEELVATPGIPLSLAHRIKELV
jgi:excinuclease ABC subunit C